MGCKTKIFFNLCLILGVLNSAIVHAQSATTPVAPKQLAQEDWHALKQAAGITVGKGYVAIHIIFDPHCPYSAKVFERLKQANLKQAIRWVPVAYFKPDSAQLAATLLQSKEPLKALEQNFALYDQQAQRGGLPVAADAPPLPQPQRYLQRRWMQWSAATPQIVIITNQRTVLAHRNPNDLAFIRAFIAHAGGLKEYENNDE
jgi:thiol:disulfide interchange protein DsbG